jgi:predicted HAD superfamily Cof-like phosphohydrolase
LGGTIPDVKQYRTTNPEEYHVAESDRRPGESERDWMKRLAEMGAAAKRKSRDEQRQQSADAQAEAAEIREALGDEVWLADATKDLFGMSPDELDAALTRAQDSSDWTSRDAQILADLDKAKKPRLLEGKKARNKRLKKHLEKNQGAIKGTAKKGKKGCAVIAVALLGTGGAALYGLFEAGRTIVSALGH